MYEEVVGNLRKSRSEQTGSDITVIEKKVYEDDQSN